MYERLLVVSTELNNEQTGTNKPSNAFYPANTTINKDNLPQF